MNGTSPLKETIEAKMQSDARSIWARTVERLHRGYAIPKLDSHSEHRAFVTAYEASNMAEGKP